VLASGDHAVSLDVTMLDGKDLAAALVTVAAAAVIGYDDLQLEGQPVSGQINGMNALFQDGHGKFHGQDVELSVGVIDTPADKFLLVVGEAETAAFHDHEHAIREFMERIKPI
jgi:prepilin-type processing-associated H-X9-DG protein